MPPITEHPKELCLLAYWCDFKRSRRLDLSLTIGEHICKIDRPSERANKQTAFLQNYLSWAEPDLLFVEFTFTFSIKISCLFRSPEWPIEGCCCCCFHWSAFERKTAKRYLIIPIGTVNSWTCLIRLALMGLTAPSRRVSYLLELLLLSLDSVISIVHNKPFNLIFQIDLPSFFISSCERVSIHSICARKLPLWVASEMRWPPFWILFEICTASSRLSLLFLYSLSL